MPPLMNDTLIAGLAITGYSRQNRNLTEAIPGCLLALAGGSRETGIMCLVKETYGRYVVAMEVAIAWIVIKQYYDVNFTLPFHGFHFTRHFNIVVDEQHKNAVA